ncbi:MAG: tetratricopeptide repeat protein [Gammaproteobacteria bacterium]|nr:tetratricopeptide repeat protein [Gammaproteobacteria bacterium]
MSALRIASALTALLSLSGCIVTPLEPLPDERGVIVSGQDSEAASSQTAPSGVEVSPIEGVQPPQPIVDEPAAPPPLANPAVAALVARAQEFAGQNQWDRAAAELERGVRIAPQDGQVWLLLAEARFQQGQYAPAVQLARRAQTLLPPGSALARRAQELIARASGQ